jgi:hypothetical protein
LFPLAVRARVFVPPGSFSSGGCFLQAFRVVGVLPPSVALVEAVVFFFFVLLCLWWCKQRTSGFWLVEKVGCWRIAGGDVVQS